MMTPAERAEYVQLGNLLAAVTGVVEELVRITHASHPEAVEAAMRRQRLLVQETRAGRFELENPGTLEAHRMQRDLWERALRLREGRDPD